LQDRSAESRYGSIRTWPRRGYDRDLQIGLHGPSADRIATAAVKAREGVIVPTVVFLSRLARAVRVHGSSFDR
jgi:hypothetical protein